MSHDHLQQLDRMLARFFGYLDQRIGLDNVVVVLSADHGFPNVPEFTQAQHMDAGRVDGDKLVQALDKHLTDAFGLEHLVTAAYLPNIHFDARLLRQAKLAREDVEQAALRFLAAQPGIAEVFTRSQMERGGLSDTLTGLLMRRAFHTQLSGDLMVVTRPYWYFSGGTTGTSHGSPYAYDTNVPLVIMGRRWITPGAYGHYAEVVDVAPTLAQLLGVRPPAGSEGRVLLEALRAQ